MTLLFQIRLNKQNVEFEASAQETILEAAQFAGTRIVSSCRNGTCRTCLCRLVSGQVRYEIAWPGLSVEEKQDGYILPCVAFATSDIVIDTETAFPIV